MSDYLSGIEPNLKVGIKSYTENKTVLEIVGNSVFSGDISSATSISAEALSIASTITASRFISTVTDGVAPISVASSTLVPNLNVNFLNGNSGSFYQDASNLTFGIVPAARLSSANDFSISGKLTVSNDIQVNNNVNVVGVLSARLLYGNGENITDVLGQKIEGFSVYNQDILVGSKFQFSAFNFVGSYVTATGIGSTARIAFTTPPYATTAGVATNVIGGIASVTTLNVSGIATINNVQISGGIVTATAFVGDGSLITGVPATGLAGIVSYAEHSGISTNVVGGRADVTTLNVTGVTTLGTVQISSGIVTATAFVGDGSLITGVPATGLAGVVTYSARSGISSYANVSGVATALQNSRSIQITGTVLSSPVFFDGTSNISIAATVQPDSIQLGRDTVGTYVSSITTQSTQQIIISGTPGEGYIPSIGLPNYLVAPQDLKVSNDLQVNRNLNVSGNITIGGTTAYINVQQLTVSDPDLVLGFRTDANGNDISNDTYGNHGGIAVASTEGSPLINLFIPGLEVTPPTYKKFMWFKQGTFAGLGTDSWLSNYAIGIGSTQFPNGTRLAVGAIQFSERDLTAIRHINSSGVVTATRFAGDGSTVTGVNAVTATTSGIATNVIGGIASVTTLNVSGVATINSVQISGGIVTATKFVGDGSAITGIIASSIVGVTSYATNSGVSSNVSGGTASVTSLNVSGVATLGSVQVSGGIVTATRFVGSLTGVADTSINLSGGVRGSVPFQKSSGITSFVDPGTTGYVLITNGPGQDPNWAPVSAASGAFGGITVRDEGNLVGTASSITTLNFVGPNIVANATVGPNGIATITVADYVSIAGYSTNSGIATNVIGGIASVTSLTVSGVTTLGVTTTTNLTAQQINVSGVSTLTTLNSTNATLTNINSTGIGTFATINATNISGTNINYTGIGTIATLTTTNIIGSAASVTSLNVSGIATISSVQFSGGIVTATRFAGDGSTLTNVPASYAPNSGIATNVIGGIASVTSLNVSGVGTNRPVQIGSGSSIIVVDNQGELGIGTTNPSYPLDVYGNARFTGNVIAANVVSLDANFGEIVRNSTGVTSTTSTNTVSIDTYDTARYRSAKYTIQVTSQGSLVPGTGSISSITGGNNYFPGTYSAVDIIPVSGVGSYAKATLTVVPEYSIVVNSCIDGVFTAAANLPSGLTTNRTSFFTQNLNLSQRQQSQVTSLTLTSAGAGYTATPSLVVAAPIIASNPVPEVGVGSTATAVVTSMIVSNAVQTSAGFVTNVIPTVTFAAPSIGVTARGLVSFGISTFNITNPGTGYTSSPTISIAAPYNPTGFAATVGLGVSTLNWVTNGGSGYTNGDNVAVSINPIAGIGTGASITGTCLGGGVITFTLTNTGFGYTAIPRIVVDSTGTTGAGATVTIASMFVSNITVNNPGTGVTVGLARTNDITFTGGGGTGAGATAATLVSTGITITTAGFGYTVSPAITYNPVGAAVAQAGLGISAVTLTSTGLGYTVLPTVSTVPGPSVGTTANPGFSTVLGYAGYAGTTLLAGPGYGGTTIYYINVLSNRTFNITTSMGSGLTPGIGTVGYGFSVGLSTARTGTVSVAGTTIITGITTTSITVGTPVQNSNVLSIGTTVAALGSNSVTLSLPATNTGSLSTTFNFGTVFLAGGRIGTVNITDIGSGYVAGAALSAKTLNFDRTSVVYDSNVGSGFTFTVANVVNNFQLSEVLTMHSAGSGNTTAYVIEESGIADTAELGEFSASLTGTGSTIYSLNFTPTFAFNVVKFNKTLFTI